MSGDGMIRQLQGTLDTLANREFWDTRPERDDAGDVLAWERGTLGRLDHMRGLEDVVAGVRHALVAEARAQGTSWELIGKALGVSRQAAWERFGTRERRPITRDGGIHLRTRKTSPQEAG